MHSQHNIINRILYKIGDRSFQEENKLSPKAFTRDRKLTFPVVVGMILRMIKQSLQITCNWLSDLIGFESVSKQAFSKARQKLSPECFKEFLEDSIETRYEPDPKKGLWMGFRLIGADGSTLRLPESDELAKEFGRGPSKEGNKKSPPMARISEFVDIANKLIVSGRIAPYVTSEEELAKEQLIEVVEKMRKLGQTKLLFIYDRGYPSAEFMKLHMKLGVDFLFRVPKNFNRAVKEIHKSKECESFLIAEDWPMLRVTQFPLSSGEDELLLTTLTDEKIYPQKALSEVYEGRWTALEEGYKKQKITMQLENFSGKTSLAVQQEYWATLLMANIIELGCIDLEGPWIPGKLPKKHINRSVIFGSMRDITMQAMHGMVPAEEYSRRFKAKAEKAMVKRRPGRQYSREGVRKPKTHHIYRRAC